MRTGADARNYREQFKVSEEEGARWITIVYTFDGKFKTLHVVAPSIQIYRMWVSTLRTLYALRRELMSGLGNLERRELVWQRQYWKAADSSGDSKLSFDEVQKMCHRLSIFPSKTDLKKQFEVRYPVYLTNGFLITSLPINDRRPTPTKTACWTLRISRNSSRRSSLVPISRGSSNSMLLLGQWNMSLLRTSCKRRRW